MTFHALRHTYAGALLSAGVPLLDVSRFLGHASISETANSYGHLLPEAGDRARAAIASAFASDDVARHGLVMADGG